MVDTYEPVSSDHHDHSHTHHCDVENGDDDHNHSHSHDHHSHDHDHSQDAQQQALVMRKLKMASGLCFFFFIAEVIGGYWAGSLAVLSDAAHLLADLASFAVAIAAAYLGSLPSTDQHTFGLRRVESLAALFSMACLAIVSIFLFGEAIHRLIVPPEQVNGRIMTITAGIGVVVNVALAIILGEHHVHMPGMDHDHCHSHDHDELETVEYGAVATLHADEVPPPSAPKRNINLHAAYLHVMGDLAQSVAVLVAGIIIWVKPSWQVVDPISTLLFCALVFYSTLGVLRLSVSVLLEEVPPHVNWKQVHEDIQALPDVAGVHDLHIWSISHGMPTMSVHLFSTGNDTQTTLREVYEVCRKHGISHATVQVQPGADEQECITCALHDTKRCHSIGESCID